MKCVFECVFIAAVSFPFLSANNVADFDGSGGSINVPNHAELRPGPAMTLECWARTRDEPGRLINMGDGISGNTNRAYDLSITDSTIIGWMFFQGTDAVRLETPFVPGPWAHIAMTFDSTQGLAVLVVDGVVVDSETHMVNGTPLLGARIRSSTYPLAFGRNNQFSVWHLDGQLDRVRIWSRALGADELRCLSDIQIDGADFILFPNLVDVWEFDNGGESESGQHNGIVSGNVSFPCTQIPSLYLESYCATSPNSEGPGAWLNSEGSTNIDWNRFAITVVDCPPNTPGAFIAGLGRIDVPVGDGRLCVHGPGLLVTPVLQTSPLGEVQFPVDLSVLVDPIAINIQFVYLDPQGLSGGINLSNAVGLEFCQ